MSPHALTQSPNEKFLYVADYYGGKVSIIRRGRAGEHDQAVYPIDLHAAKAPQAIAAAPDGRTAYVTPLHNGQLIPLRISE